MAERLVISDRALVQELHRWIKEELEGSRDRDGLYRVIAKGVPNSWDTYQKMVGQVQGLEAVLGKMQELAGKLGIYEEQVLLRPGMH